MTNIINKSRTRGSEGREEGVVGIHALGDKQQKMCVLITREEAVGAVCLFKEAAAGRLGLIEDH